jgi:signal transduction histidine kinase
MSELLQVAINATSMSAVRAVLRVIAQRTDSDGCILWRVTPEESARDLFVAQDWFAGNARNINHSLPLDRSLTGRAILSGSQISSALEPPDRDDFLATAGMGAMCAFPITFPDGVVGALNLYRRHGPGGDTRTWNGVDEYARDLPLVLRVIQDRVALTVLKSLDVLLDGVDRSARPGTSIFDLVQTAMTQVCHDVARALNCLEVSIYLEDAFKEMRQFRLAGTSFPAFTPVHVYRASEEDGITGWSLAHPETRVLVFNVDDAAGYARRYPGMHWRDADDTRSLRGTLALAEATDLPPLSYMSVPLRDGPVVVGILRCSVGLGPTYFDEQQYALLEQMAVRIAQLWTAIVRSRSLEMSVVGLRALNDKAYAALIEKGPREAGILSETLRILAEVVPGAETSDVRLLSGEGRELAFAAVHGAAWDRDTPEEREKRLRRVFPVDTESPLSAGADAVQSGRTRIVDERNDDADITTLPSMRRMIVAPMALGSDVYGVLDVRSSMERDLPEFAVPIIELLASQLALYRQLSFVVDVLAQRVAELTALREQQIQTYADLAHQLRSSILVAHRLVVDAVRSLPESDNSAFLLRLRGLLRRSVQVTYSSEAFARLARNETISLTQTTISADELIHLIIEVAQDTAYLAGRGEDRKFRIEREGFKAEDLLHADRVLLEQALTQLLDNAFKYSFEDSVVVVSLAWSRRSNGPQIFVTSEGIRLAPEDVPNVTRRGWQSEDARNVSGSGSGIGLWIVDQIMRAHKGSLEIRPTDAQGRTTVALLFPGKIP